MGRFICGVSAMLEISVFFENQVKECNSLAERASDKSGREFWLRAAKRWEALLAERREPLNVKVSLQHPYRRERAYFRKRSV
jgi:hypothetical protein